MEILIQNLIFAFKTIAPVFLILFLGIFLKQINIIDAPFISTSSKLVFNVALPVFLFMKLSSTNFAVSFDLNLIGYIYSGILASYLLTWLIASKFIKEKKDLGSFVQGAFRSNFAIVGLAVIYSVFGDEGLTKGSIVLALIVPILNLLSIITLEINSSGKLKINYKEILLKLARNPLLISVIIATPFSLFKIKIHETLIETGDYISAITLPLALIGIGGSLNLKSFKQASKLAFAASSVKIIFIPLIFTIAACYLNFSNINLGIIFIFFACPTAIVSYIMADAMGCNSKLAGNIIVISTTISVLTISIGIFILKIYNLI